MKFPLSWLKEYVKLGDINPKDFADSMTMTGTMVENIEETGKGISNVVLGRVESVKKHPNADKLVVCKVDIGSKFLQIVTASPKMLAGVYVPVALDGATLPFSHKDGQPMVIKAGEMRGVKSEGMMCGQDELIEGVPKSETVWFLEDMQEDWLGTDIKQILSLNEVIIEVELTANRPDCQSIIGVSREAAATFGSKMKDLAKNSNIEKFSQGKCLDVSIKDFALCPRYSALRVESVKIEESPEWLKKRLHYCGIRSINNIVDITNYVMLEYGQPLHAFDVTKLKGEKIIVRRAQNGETITTLDDVERQLNDTDLVICDAEKPVAIAGIMGGEFSGIDNTSTTVIFESANFNAFNIRKTSKRIGLKTDASSRYEKGIDPHLTTLALARVAELLKELKCGSIVGFTDVSTTLPATLTIEFNPKAINTYLGTNINPAVMKGYLSNVGIHVVDGFAHIPSYRADMSHMQDLAEEIARFYGYENIVSSPLSGSANNRGLTKRQKVEQTTHSLLTACGFNEIMTYSFIDPRDYAKIEQAVPDTVSLRNPLGAEHSIMRTQSTSSMLGVLEHNSRMKNSTAWLYELATVYKPIKGSSLPTETTILTLGAYGNSIDFFSLKGSVENLLNGLNVKPFMWNFPKDLPEYFHPFQTAELNIRGKAAGLIGALNPKIARNFSLKNPFLAEINFEVLADVGLLAKKYEELPKYPAIERDLAIVVNKDLPVGEIEKIINKVRSPIFESYKLFDVYEGEQVGENKKSVAFNFTFRAKDRTLKDDEANDFMGKLRAELSSKKMEVRG